MISAKHSGKRLEGTAPFVAFVDPQLWIRQTDSLVDWISSFFLDSSTRFERIVST